MRVAIGRSIVVLCCSPVTPRRPAKSALEIRSNQPSPTACQGGLAVTVSTTRLRVHGDGMAEQEDGIT